MLLFAQSFFYIANHRAVFLHQFPQLVFGNAELARPAFSFPIFVNIDPVLIWVATFCQIIWHGKASAHRGWKANLQFGLGFKLAAFLYDAPFALP